MTSIAQKARELLEDLAYDRPTTANEADEKWIGLDWYDPPHGKSEVTYAASHGFIEKSADGNSVRLTSAGRKHLGRKKRSDAA